MEGFNAGMKGAKGSADEGGFRVPFFVRWQGKLESGTAVQRLSAHIDLLPTLRRCRNQAITKGSSRTQSGTLLKNPKAKRKDRYLTMRAGKQVLNQRTICGKVLRSGTSVFVW